MPKPLKIQSGAIFAVPLENGASDCIALKRADVRHINLFNKTK